MVHTYRYSLVDGHIIAMAGQLSLLIDTGAPSSVSDSAPLVLTGRSHATQRSYMGVTPASLGESIGTSINALVGVDILNQYDTLIDPPTRTISMSEAPLPLKGVTLDVDNCMGIPIIEAMAGEHEVRMFFDTGAKLSYLDPDLTASFPEVGAEDDFYPRFGVFSTRVFDIPINLGEETIVLRAGNLPSILQMTLMMADTSGILGTALLRTHRVTFAPRRKAMALSRISG
jgi:hypothetical protein